MQLLLACARVPERSAERPVQVERARRPHGFGDGALQRYGHRRDAPPLDFPRDQTGRPVAQASGGGQQHEVGALVAEERGERGRRLAQQRLEMPSIHVTHQAGRSGRERPEVPGRDEFA